ncbi:MAG: transposase [Janthinobacterium lividum]
MQDLDEFSDQAWAKLAPHLAGKLGDVGRSGDDNRLFLNAIFWVACHGCVWRPLPVLIWQARYRSQT